MFALYFCQPDATRAIIVTLTDRGQAVAIARLLSAQDPRDVVIIDNTDQGDTVHYATFRRGVRVEAPEQAGSAEPPPQQPPRHNPS
jgi:hypothetical protein